MSEKTIEIVIRGKNLSAEAFSAARKELRDLEKAQGDAEKGGKSFGESFGAVAAKAAIAGAAIYQVATIAAEWIAAANAQETATAQLNAALQAQGTFTQPLSDSYAALASEFERTTGNSDELLMSMQAMLVQVGNVGPKDMRAALQAAADLSAGLGIDLTSATKAVAKAFDGGGTAIVKMLPSLKDMVREGATTQEVLAALQERFGGQAQAQMQTYAGKMKAVANEIDNTKESMGDIIKRGLTPLVDGFLSLPGPIRSGAVVLGTLAGSATAVVAAVTAVSAAIAMSAPLFGMSAAAVGASALAGLTTAASAAAAAFWPLSAAIAAVWAAWKLGNTETVKNTVATWALSSDNLTAKLYRLVAGIDQMTPAAARSAVAATAAAEAARAHATAADEQGASVGRVAPAIASFSDKLAAAQKQVASLSAEQRAQIQAGVAMGQSTEEILKGMKALYPTVHLTETSVKLYTESLKKAETAGKKTAEQQKELAAFIKQANAEWSRIPANAFKASEAVTAASERMAKATIDNALIQKNAQDELNDMAFQRIFSQTEYQILQIERWAYNEKLKLDQSVANWAAAAADIEAIAQRKTQTIIEQDELAQRVLFANLDTAADKADNAWAKAAKRLGDVSTILGQLPGKFFEVASVAARTGEAIASNLAEGDMFGAVIAGITGAVTIVGKLFTDQNKIQVQKYNAEIEKLRQGLLTTHGTLDDLEVAAQRVGLSFKDNWGQQGQKGLEAMNALMKEFEQRTKAVDAALGRVSSGFGAVVTGMTKPWIQLGKELDDAIKKVADARKKLTEFRDDDQGDAHTKALLAYREAAEEEKRLVNAINATAGQAKQHLADLGVQAVSSFGAAMVAGKSYSEAITLIGPSLATLGESYKTLGLDVEDVGLKHLILQSTVAKANPELIAATSGLGDSMQGLAQLGMLNVDTFGAMQRTGMAMYVRLQGEVGNLGGSTRDALLPMQGYLQQAATQAALLGIPLDANTQMLIDQSKELGIWKDKGKSANDLLIEGMGTLVKKVDELLTRLLGVSTTISGLPRRTDLEINVTENVTRNVNEIRTGGDEPQYATGTHGMFPDFSDGTRVVLHHREAVTPYAERIPTAKKWLQEAGMGMAAAASITVAAPPVYIVNDFTGHRIVTESELRQIQSRLHSGELQVPERAITKRGR